MKTKIRITLLSAFLFLMLSGVQAQEKYEYAVIQYVPTSLRMDISINGIDYINTRLVKEKVKSKYDMNPPLEEINRMSEDGWELFNTGNGYDGAMNFPLYIFYLRKKG